jgi:hypothetical protein
MKLQAGDKVRVNLTDHCRRFLRENYLKRIEGRHYYKTIVDIANGKDLVGEAIWYPGGLFVLKTFCEYSQKHFYEFLIEDADCTILN